MLLGMKEVSVVLRSLSGVLLFVLLIGNAAPAQEGAATPAPAQSAANYPDSPEGLRKMLEELLSATRQKEVAKVQAIHANMTLPDYEHWFVRAFGEHDGSKLAALYAKEIAEWDSYLNTAFDPAARLKKLQLNVSRVESTHQGPLGDVYAALREPATLYTARTGTPREASALQLGYFFYVAGQFRFVDAAVLSALSLIKVYRIQVDANVAVAALIHQVNPIPPREARKIQGTVVLRAIIAADGAVKELEVVSGHPRLTQAALDAVRQWRFRPILVDGWPVEVETTISIGFSSRG
jgi:TonB family protein